MPLIKTLNPHNYIFIGVWVISETLEELTSISNDDMIAESEEIKHPQKKLEFLASRKVLEEMCSLQEVLDVQIFKNLHGKPFFKTSDWHFSISHTEKYAVCAISKYNPIGVDVEKIQDKFGIIAQKFLTELELKICAMEVEKIAERWCIKEAAYKWNGEKGLSFKDEIMIDENSQTVAVKGIQNRMFVEKIDEEHFLAIVY